MTGTSSARNRLRWATWILTYICAYVPPLVDMKMNNKNWEWYAWLGWGPLVTTALILVIMFLRGSRIHGTIINCILIGALVSIGMLIYSSYRTYDAVGPKASETDRMKSKSTFLTSVISGALAAVSMIIQWLESM